MISYKSDNITQVLSLLLTELFIPVTRGSIYEELHKHPDFPSILSMSDVLNGWNVPNASYQLSVEELGQMPIPFIAHFDNGFVVVNHFGEKEVVVSNEKWKNRQLDIEEFKSLYKGAVLAAKKDEISGETDYALKQKRENINKLRLPFVISTVLILFFIFLILNPSYTSAFNWSILFLTIFKTAGLVTSILLLIQSIDNNNPLIKKLCGGNNKHNCKEILSSKAANVNGLLSWAEVGFFYFSGSWLILLFNSGSTSLIQMLAFLNLVSLPYTFYSIYYQWRVAKVWCLFCCTVQGLLWLEFIVFLPYLTNIIQSPNLTEWVNLLMGLVIPILIWIFIKPYMLQAQQVQPLKQQLRKFKYNTEIFNNMLNKEVQYRLLTEDNSIMVGNQDAEDIITVVSNPYCESCAKAHQDLEEWLGKRDDIQLQVIFAIDMNERNSSTKVAKHFMALNLEQDRGLLRRALDDWYGQKHNFERWLNKYPLKEDIINLEVLEKQSEWCKMAEITATPTVFINGRKFPLTYDIEDIRYFI